MAEIVDPRTSQTRTEPNRQQDFQREDTRWERAATTRDWIILLAFLTFHTAWMLTVFFLEPGIR